MLILSPFLRKIRKDLKRYNVLDFAFNRKLKDTFDSTIDAEEFIKSCAIITNATNHINEQQYIFLMKLYSENKDLYNTFKQRINMFPNLDYVDSIYSHNIELFKILLDYPNIFNKEYIDFYGEDFLLDNAEILDYISKISLEDVEQYIEILKEHPQSFKTFYNILKSNDSSVKELLNYLDNKNLEECYQLLPKVFQKALKEFLLNNINNDKVIEFVKNVVQSGKEPNNYDDIFLVESSLKESSPNSIIEIKKYLLYYLKNNSTSYSGLANLLLGVRYSDTLLDQANYLKKNNIPVPEELEKVLKVYEIIGDFSKITDEYCEHYLKGDLNVDYYEMYKLLCDINEKLINNDLTDIKSLKDGEPILYRHSDNNGDTIEEKIPVKIIDNIDFDILVHSIVKDKVKDHASNANIAKELYEKPQLWTELGSSVGNDELSTSYFDGFFKPFGSSSPNSAIVIGFNRIPDNSLLLTYSGDRGTDMKKSHKKGTILKFHQFPFVEKKELEDRFANYNLNYNEVLLDRFPNSNVILPDYLIIKDTEATDEYTGFENVKKWASYYKIPIVIIDTKKIIQQRKNIIDSIVEKIKSQDFIEEYDAKMLNKQMTHISVLSRDYNIFKEAFLIIEEIMNSVTLTIENAEGILSFMDSTGIIGSSFDYDKNKTNYYFNHSIKCEDKEIKNKLEYIMHTCVNNIVSLSLRTKKLA